MISYTVTTQKTQGQYRHSFTQKLNYTFNIFDFDQQLKPNETLGDFGVYIRTEAYGQTFETFFSSDGASSRSNSLTGSATGVTPGNPPEFSFSGTVVESNLLIIDSNLAATGEGVRSETGYYNENETDDNPAGTTSFDYGGPYASYTTLTPTTISGITTTTQDQQRFLRTSKTQIVGTTVATTSESDSSTFITVKITTTSEIIGTFSLAGKNVATTTTQEISTNLVTEPGRFLGQSVFILDPPRDTATIFCKFENVIVWVPTATDLVGAGPWALSDIATSHTTDFTAKPLYSTRPLLVIAQEEATFPSPPETLETITETRVGLSYVTAIPQQVWISNTSGGFPLISTQSFFPVYTTFTTEYTYQNFTENNPALTIEATEIGQQTSNSIQLKNRNLTYQEFYEFSYVTTRYLGTWSATSSTQYAGISTVNGAGTEIISVVNAQINFAQGETIWGTNVEQIQIRAFSPCAVSHVETNFRQAWGLHGNSGPEPKNQISFDGSLSLRFTDFVELLPGVSAPFPTTYSWSTGNSTLSASLAGNAITISTTSGTGSNASTASSTYQFQGEGSAYTEQISDRSFFLNSQGLPALSFFGPHAATESIETRARPGEYVRIVQDSLGAFTLSTLTLETTAASIISENAILFPGEKSFYTTTGGVPFLTFSRNPVP
jgi:hypothetical protein